MGLIIDFFKTCWEAASGNAVFFVILFVGVIVFVGVLIVRGKNN